MDKIPSEIIRIELTDASYKGTKSVISPTYVNFFFGNNGTGKSTIAKAIQNGDGVKYRDGRTKNDYIPLVFNREFINENFKSYRNMRGVFTLNSRNVEIQRQIDTITPKISEIQEEINTKNEELSTKKSVLEKNQKNFFKSCWDKEADFRLKFDKTQDGKGKARAFTEEILRHEHCNYDLNEFCRMYESAFSDSAKRYKCFNTIADVQALDRFAENPIFSSIIVNSSDTDLAVFLRKINAVQWMQQGHADYSECAEGKCPYCGRTLPDDFEQTFIESFDIRYQEDMKKLNLALEQYGNTAKAIFIPLQTTPSEIYPQIDYKIYSDKLAVLKSLIQDNVSLIREKISEPSKKIELLPTETIMREIADIITEFNNMIRQNNAILDEKPKKQKECTDIAFSILAFRLMDDIDSYRDSLKSLRVEIAGLEEVLEKKKQDLRELKAKLQELRKQTIETDSAKDSINAMLRDSGMQGFSLVPKKDAEHAYEVRRPDNTIADNLSEGEKNFIAFLYFYHLVNGSSSADADTREKIVVVDDPVSSMDSSNLFIVSTLVNQMIENCRNNADNRNRVVEGNYIKQIFILTHNAYFHKDISYGYVSKYEYVSYYLIRKTDSKSSIKLCESINPEIRTERINVNPVKNSYAALWDEYKEIKSAVPLMNVIRRILEYYFLQLCGYEGSTLRQEILVKGREEGRFTDEFGKADEEKFQLASSMLAYINASKIGLNEGLDFVEECINTEECRNIFEMIFTVMKQEQHYKMMMGIR